MHWVSSLLVILLCFQDYALLTQYSGHVLTCENISCKIEEKVMPPRKANFTIMLSQIGEVPKASFVGCPLTWPTIVLRLVKVVLAGFPYIQSQLIIKTNFNMGNLQNVS